MDTILVTHRRNIINQTDGAPGTIRTCDRLVRSQVLYPAELRALKPFIIQASRDAINKIYGGERGIRTLDRGKPIRP